MIEHKHLIIRAKIGNPVVDEEYIKGWLNLLIKKIDMKILMGPYSTYCDMKGNRGMTAVAIIQTSHIALHMWDEESPGTLQLDVYSCSEFDVEDVLKQIEVFQPVTIDYYFIDRKTEIKLIENQRK